MPNFVYTFSSTSGMISESFRNIFFRCRHPSMMVGEFYRLSTSGNSDFGLENLMCVQKYKITKKQVFCSNLNFLRVPSCYTSKNTYFYKFSWILAFRIYFYRWSKSNFWGRWPSDRFGPDRTNQSELKNILSTLHKIWPWPPKFMKTSGNMYFGV